MFLTMDVIDLQVTIVAKIFKYICVVNSLNTRVLMRYLTVCNWQQHSNIFINAVYRLLVRSKVYRSNDGLKSYTNEPHRASKKSVILYGSFC